MVSPKDQHILENGEQLYQVEDGWIELRSGTMFHFGMEPPELSKFINLYDVATSLSRLCRYNGHSKRLYSVAEHACLMADWVFNQPGRDALDALTALHHDDAEYIIGDLPRPIKVKMPQFKALEARLDEAIAYQFGTQYPFPDWLKEADTRILVDERKQVMATSPNNWGTDLLAPLGIKTWSVMGRYQWYVRRQFIKRHSLYKAIAKTGAWATY